MVLKHIRDLDREKIRLLSTWMTSYLMEDPLPPQKNKNSNKYITLNSREEKKAINAVNKIS